MKTNANMLKLVALAMVVLIGCTQNQVLASLEATVAATEVLLTSLQATGRISPSVANSIESAIADLPTAFRETATELASSDSAAIMAVKITGYYSSTITSLRALPSEAQFYTAAISAGIQAFLSGLEPAQVTRSLARGTVPTRFDAERLDAIAHRADILGVRLAEKKAKAPVSKKEGGK